MKNILNKKQWIFLLLGSAVVIQMIQLDGEWERMDGDDAQFILEAQSLITHHRYNHPNWVYTPEASYITKSDPPGWPLLLIPVLLIFGKELLFLKIYVILFALGAGLLLFKILMMRTADYGLSLLITGIYYFSMTTIVFSRLVYTEWSYMVVSFLIIILMLGMDQGPESKWRWIWVGLLAGFSLLLRSVAIAIVLAILAMIVQEKLIVEREIRSGIKRLGVVLILILFITQAVTLVVRPDKGHGYQGQFLSKNLYFPEEGKASLGDLMVRTSENGRQFILKMEPLIAGRNWHELMVFQFPHISRWIDVILYITGSLIFILIMMGYISQVLQKPSIVEYYIFFYMAIMSIIWFHYEIYRYLMPITPFLIYYFAMGIRFAVAKFRQSPQISKSVMYGTLTFLLIVNLCHAGIEVYRYKWSDRRAKIVFAPYKKAVAWLKAHVKPGDIIIADDPRWYALETEHPVTLFPISKDHDVVYEYINRYTDTVIVFDPMRHLSKVCLQPVLEKYSERFQFIEVIGHLKIYRHRTA